MAGVRSMLARVARLEQARAPVQSPIERWYGSLEAFAAETQAGIDSGTLDSRDMPIVLRCIRRWHEDEVWSLWQRDRIWEYSR